MKQRLTTLWSASVATTVVTLLIAGSAAAADPKPAPPLSDGAVKCRSAVAKSYSKLVGSAAKTIASCHKSRNGGKILSSVNCNDMDEADSAGKFASSAAKITDTFAKSCGGLDGTLVNVDYYMSCPVASCGLPNPMTTLAQVATCLGCTAASIAEDVSDATLGMPDPLLLSKDDGKCHGAIAKGYQKYLTTGNKDEHACQGTSDAEGVNTLDGCIDADAKGKVAGALQKAGEGLDKSCALATLANLDSCANDSLANLKSCNAAAYDAAGDEGFTTAYELPATICPTAVRTTIRAGCSTNSIGTGNCQVGGNTDSTLSVGWTGLAHGVDIVDQYSISASLDCPGSEAGSCGDCTILGVDSSDPQYSSFARCDGSPWTPCTNVFGPDVACGGGTCAYYLGAPLPVSAGGTPTCTLNRIFSNITGTADPDAGSSELFLDLRAKVHNGVGQTQPCPICENDTTPQDGVTSGTCKGGVRNNQPCDVQAFDLSFAPTDEDNPTSGPSLDCPPAAAANISGGGLRIPLPLTTGTTSLPFGDSCDSPNGAESCACGVCSHDNAISCNGDAECDALSGGATCEKGASGATRSPNSCTGFTCETVGDATDRGQCANVNDKQKYCSGALRATGQGIIACAINEDCDAYSIEGAGVCPNDDCGTCTLETRKSCFLDPIEVAGTADVENPVLAGLFCLPPTSNSGVNSASGTPGPGEVKVDAIAELYY